MDSMNPFVDLSTELLCLIIDHLPFTMHLDFACTCKRFASAAEYVLGRHQEAHDKYSVASDLEPSTIALLLRSAFNQDDPLPAWHVRSLEIWRDRTELAEWKIYDLQTPLSPQADCAPSTLPVPLEDVREYLEWFDEYANGDTEEEFEKAFDQIENGHDGLLKALLIAKLPCLRDIKFVSRSQDEGSTLLWLKLLISLSGSPKDDDTPWPRKMSERRKERWDEYKSELQGEELHPIRGRGIDESEAGSRMGRHGPIENLSFSGIRGAENEMKQNGETQLFDKQLSKPASFAWPDGFANLRHVAVGVCSGTWMDDEQTRISHTMLAHLLRLPNIESLYVKGLQCEDIDIDYDEDPDEDEADAWKIIPPGSSTVKHLFFDGLERYTGEPFDDALFDAPRKLQTAAFRFAGSEVVLDSATTLFDLLASYQGCYLESLMWYGYEDGNIQGDHCTLSYTKEFAHLHAVKQVSFSVQDLALSAYHGAYEEEAEEGETEDEFYVRYVTNAFPETMETLVLWDRGGCGHTGDADGETTLLERALVKMITGGRYKNLKSIFVEEVERAREGPRTKTLWFQEAVVAGLAAGVDVHTRTNSRPMQHKIKFPEGVDEYDLRTGIHPEGRPSDWVFNAWSGRRGAPGCKCGNCQHCHSQYSPELWNQVRYTEGN